MHEKKWKTNTGMHTNTINSPKSEPLQQWGSESEIINMQSLRNSKPKWLIYSFRMNKHIKVFQLVYYYVCGHD